MKKFLLSIFAVMLAVFSVQAEEVSGTITFKTSGSDSSNAATANNFVSGQVTDNGGFTLSCTATNNCYTGKSGLKMSSSKASGSFTLNLGDTYNVKRVVVNAVKYSSDAAKLSVNSATVQTLTESLADYTFDINDEISTIKVDMTKRGYINSITVVYEVAGEGGGETPDVPVLETLATPVISPESCEFNMGGSVNVTISAVEGAKIYYTLDGTTPTESSAVYSSALSIEETTTVKAIAVKDGYNNSEVAAATFTAVDPNAKTTTFDFTKPAELTPSVTTFTSQAYNTTGTTFTSDGITLNTTDGSTASRIWEGSSYDLRVYKNATMTIAAPAGGIITSIEFTGGTVNSFSADSGVLDGKIWAGNASKVVFTWSSSASTQKINTITVAYSIDESIVVIAQPSLTPATSFVGSTTVEITNNEEGTTLYYSTNGEDYEPYTGALTISETTTVYAYAQDAQENKSAVAEATYTKIEVLSIAEAKAAYDAAGTDVDVAVDLTGAVVTVNNGQYLFIENETTGINIYNSGAEYAEGTKFTAGYILGTSTTYRNMHQLSNVEFCGVETTTVTVEPLEVAIADIAGNYEEYEGRFVKFTGVSIDADKNMTQGDDEYKAYDRFALGFGAIANCDVTGVVAIYNTGEQLYIKDITYTLAVSDAEYATLFLDFAAAIPAGVEAYTVTEVNDGYVTLTQVEGVLPASTGVIVKADEANYTFAYSTETPATVEGNLLVGTTVDEEIAEEAYVLGNVDGVGLYKADMAGGVWLNNANKAYLPMPAGAEGIKSFSFRFGEGTTAIGNVEVENEVKAIYDLTGRRVEEIAAPGIYIVNGKKVLVK